MVAGQIQQKTRSTASKFISRRLSPLFERFEFFVFHIDILLGHNNFKLYFTHGRDRW